MMSVDGKSPSVAEMDVRRARELLANRRYGEALQVVHVRLAEVPENRDLLYLQAMSQRYLGQVPQALATLDVLERKHPQFSLLYEERGHCHVVLQDASRAIEALLRAVNINPELSSSWGMLERLYRMRGDEGNARTAAARVATLERWPRELIYAARLFCDGDLTPAEDIVRTYLQRHGIHVEAMRLLAKIGIARNVLDDAEVLLAAVLEVAPDSRAARYDYAVVLTERQKCFQAREELEKLLRLEPENREYRMLYAKACAVLGDHERAVSIYRELLVEAAQPAELYLSLGHALKTLGRVAQAVEAYRAAAAARRNFGDAYWSLANLKTYQFLDSEISYMRGAEAAPTTAVIDRYHLCFALGKAFEDRREYSESWRYYAQGNSLKRAESRYRPQIIENNTRLQIATCTREFFAARAGVGAQSAEPIFIVGLPRSGSTLLEQILASHSCIEGTQELADIPRIVLELQGRDPDPNNPRYPSALTDMSPADFLRLGDRFVRDTRGFRTGKPFFIDKMPNNFRHLGLIHLMLPNARIIDARREPMACCFSNLKQLFAAGQEFSYSIEDIARYYRTYLDLMRHWHQVLPGKILTVHHEDVVENLEGSVRRILEFCGLELESACVEFYKTDRSVRTASSEQVRLPIFREALEQWKHYECWLEPLKEALGDCDSSGISSQETS